MSVPSTPPTTPGREAGFPAGAASEADRERALRRYDILDTPAESAFDRVTNLAARLFDVPVVTLGFVDGGRVWFKSNHGLADDEVRREFSVCSHFVAAGDGGGGESADAARDPAWADHPLVVGPFGLRAFLVVPLVAPDGPVLGSFCLVDRRPRAWTTADRANLHDLAGIVMDELELRRQARVRWQVEQETSAARYRELFEASPQPMWVYDLETLRFLAVNRAAVSIYGYSHEEFLGGLTLADIRPPEDVPDLLENVHRPGDHDGRLLWRHRRKDGSLMDVEIASNALITFAGRPARLVMAYNVSERTAVGEALQVRERHLAGLVETQRELLRAPSVWGCLPHLLETLGCSADADRACLFGVGRGPAPGRRFFADLREEWCAPGVRSLRDQPETSARVYPADFSVFPLWLGKLTHGEIVVLGDSLELNEAERHYLEVRGMRSILFAPLLVRGTLTGVLSFHYRQEPHALLRGEHNPLLGAATALSQAFERERAVTELGTESRRLGVTLAALTEGVITTDAENRVVLLNRAAETLTGHPAATSIGRPLRELFRTFEEPEGGSLRAVSARADQAGGGNPEHSPLVEGRHRVWLESADGRRRLIDKVSIPLFEGENNGGRFAGVVRVFHDVTDEERTAAELLRASKLDSLGVLAGGIAHDFNNLLTAILGNVSLARLDGLPGSPTDEKLAQAEHACLHARDLTRQLLTFARGGAPLKKLARLPEIIRESVGFALHGSPVNISFRLPTDLWPVEVDTGQLSQVLNNLVINGVQAIGRGGGTLEVCAENLLLPGHTLPALPGGRYVKISVEDDGGGIAAEHLEKIFDPFFSTKPGGSGLGLATSYSIAKRHGGHLNVDSVPGVGSIFRLFLPAAEEKAAGGRTETAVPKTPPAARQPLPSNLRVLVLDDEPAVRALLRDMLGHLGAEVVTVATGLETLDAYRRARTEGPPFDLLILDLTLPGGMGGNEVLTTLRQEDPEVHAIASSGYAHDPIVSRYAENGFAGVLSKPYRLDELAAALQTGRRAGKKDEGKA